MGLGIPKKTILGHEIANFWEKMAGVAVVMYGVVSGALGFSLGVTIHASGVSPINAIANDCGLSLGAAQGILVLTALLVLCFGSLFLPGNERAGGDVYRAACTAAWVCAVFSYVLGAFAADYVSLSTS